MNGLYALPGLIDTHAHVTLGPVLRVMDARPIYMKAAAGPDIFKHTARYMLSCRSRSADFSLNKAPAKGFGPDVGLLRRS